MIRTLCFFWSLAMWLGFGENQTLTQPPTVSVSTGATATLECNVGTKDTLGLFWYKQTPGMDPKWILFDHHSFSVPRYGPGFSSDRFTTTINSAGTIYQLNIKNVELNDAAVYYCGKWCLSLTGFSFSPGTKLFVTDQQLPEPSVKLLGPSAEEISAKGTGTLVCLVSKLSVGFPVVSWTVDGSPTSRELKTSAVRRDTDKTFSLSSYLTVPGAEWSSGKVYSCVVKVGAASTTSATVTRSNC